jgi:hypothetical protein
MSHEEAVMAALPEEVRGRISRLSSYMAHHKHHTKKDSELAADMLEGRSQLARLRMMKAKIPNGGMHPHSGRRMNGMDKE